jgi:hypothetical protein
MMNVQITCEKCKSSVEVIPTENATKALCDVCGHITEVKFTQNHLKNQLKECAVCERQDFFIQKDFNRKVGVTLFIIASILSIWTYGISFIVLYAMDFFLFKKLHYVAVCYKCNTIYRGAENTLQIPAFDHEMHDRIVYADHDFKGKPISH